MDLKKEQARFRNQRLSYGLDSSGQRLSGVTLTLIPTAF